MVVHRNESDWSFERVFQTRQETIEILNLEMLEVRIQFLIFTGVLIISAIIAGLIAIFIKARDTRTTSRAMGG